MELNTALEEMEVVLNELNEQFETIKKNEVRVPQIEIDIIMATMRRLYESMSHLHKQKPVEQVEKVEEIEKETAEIKAEVEILAEVATEVPEAIVEEVLEETTFAEEPADYEKATNDFQEEIDALEESVQNEYEEEKVVLETEVEEKIKETPKPSLLLQFEDEVFSVNDSVAQKAEDKSLVNKLNNTRIENLKSAIGINDKFYFINELFNGNSQAYEDVIYTLNNFKRFEEAMQYISTLKHKYDWSTETEAYQKLTHFLERKFVEVHA